MNYSDYAGYGLSTSYISMSKAVNNKKSWINWLTKSIKPYFNVNTKYVYNKIFLIIVPYKNHNWEEKVVTDEESIPTTLNSELTPSYSNYNINSPDMYIPSLFYATSIVLNAISMGVIGKFKPEVPYTFFTKLSIILIFQTIIMYIGCYFLNIESPRYAFLDKVSCLGYQYVGLCFVIASSIFLPFQFQVLLIIWFFFANTFFLYKFFKKEGKKIIILMSLIAAIQAISSFSIVYSL